MTSSGVFSRAGCLAFLLLAATASQGQVLDGGFEASTDVMTNPYWLLDGAGQPFCRVVDCGNDGGLVGPRSGVWWAWLGRG